MRSWAIAIGLSVALHLGLAALMGSEVRPEPVAVRVEKTEGKGEVVSFTPVSVVERPVVVRREEVPPRVPARTVAAEKRSDPHPDPLPKGEGDTGTEGEGDTVAEGVEEGDAEAAPSASTKSDFVTEAVLVGPSPEVIALVHARLAAAAEGCYPPVARRYQQRGTVQLSFCTDAAGGAASSSVTISSGAEVLDAAARGCVVERASPFPAVAASRCFSVPVRFGAR